LGEVGVMKFVSSEASVRNPEAHCCISLEIVLISEGLNELILMFVRHRL
jgi:hypothetical protein